MVYVQEKTINPPGVRLARSYTGQQQSQGIHTGAPPCLTGVEGVGLRASLAQHKAQSAPPPPAGPRSCLSVLHRSWPASFPGHCLGAPPLHAHPPPHRGTFRTSGAWRGEGAAGRGEKYGDAGGRLRPGQPGQQADRRYLFPQRTAQSTAGRGLVRQEEELPESTAKPSSSMGTPALLLHCSAAECGDGTVQHERVWKSPVNSSGSIPGDTG